MTTVAMALLMASVPQNQIKIDGGLKPTALDRQDLYPYRSEAFSGFVNDSYQSPQGANKFYGWLSNAYKKKAKPFSDKPHLTLDAYLAFKKRDLGSTSNPDMRVHKEKIFAANLHRVIKEVLPKFSLNEGFEFKNAVKKGERQCFLQSVLIAGLLQAGGVPAGVAMVNRNIQGEETNNKHAVCLARLSNGHDLIVDASDDLPFVNQQGLFLANGDGYRFVRPVYETDHSIVAYRAFENRYTFAVDQVRPLDVSFVRSQFEYYRGERTPGSVMDKQKTTAGIALSAAHLAKSIAECPQNPLAMYMYGKVLGWERSMPAAHARLQDAMRLYERAGWVPPDERIALSTLSHGA